MTILVIGATGRVGRHVVDQLVQRDADVRVLTRNPTKATFPADVEVVQGDLLDIDALRAAFSGVSTLFLLNAVTGDEFTQAIITLNVAREAGVPADAVARIFRPFHTTKADGTGVGLSLARQIALAHGGTLTLASDAPTRFRLTIP